MELMVELIAACLGAMFVTFLLAVRLAATLGRPTELRVGGLVVAFAIPFVLAIWDPDGSCDESQFMGCFLNLSPGNWFVLGGIGTFLLYLAWAIGVRVGSPRASRPQMAPTRPR